MKKINVLILNLLLISVLSACYYDVESELYPTATITACDTVKPTYAGVIQPLIGSSCAISGCHVNGAQTPDLSSYSGLKAAIERVKARAITEKSMPPSGALGNCNIEYLQTWINAGALND